MLPGFGNFLNSELGGDFFANSTQAIAYAAYPYLSAATLPTPFRLSPTMVSPKRGHARAVCLQYNLDQQRIFEL